jgi:ribosomal protein L22
LSYDILCSTKNWIGGERMSEQALQAVAIQKSLGLSKQDALKVLVFITGMQAGKELQLAEQAAEAKQMAPGRVNAIRPA